MEQANPYLTHTNITHTNITHTHNQSKDCCCPQDLPHRSIYQLNRIAREKSHEYSPQKLKKVMDYLVYSRRKTWALGKNKMSGRFKNMSSILYLKEKINHKHSGNP